MDTVFPQQQFCPQFCPHEYVCVLHIIILMGGMQLSSSKLLRAPCSVGRHNSTRVDEGRKG